jgi:hypothetical protein
MQINIDQKQFKWADSANGNTSRLHREVRGSTPLWSTKLLYPYGKRKLLQPYLNVCADLGVGYKLIAELVNRYNMTLPMSGDEFNSHIPHHFI